MRRTLLSAAALCIFALSAPAVEVDREELETSIDRDIEFRNYEGPLPEDVDTLEEILGIGEALAAGDLEAGSVASYADRYRVIHAVDPSVREGLDADIFIILDDANVNHIDNVRRIVSAFLQEAYDYSAADAETIAEFVTIYNAIYRGNMEFVGARYKPVVVDNVSASTVGISTLYSDWPGATRMLIPLTPDAAPGDLGAVDSLQLADEGVTERLRQEEDRGIEERQDMADLMEREADQREERIEEEREDIADEREDIAEEQDRLEEEREELEAERETTPEDDGEARRELDEREQELEEREEELEDRQEDLEDREEEVQGEEERVADLRDEAREQREEIAEDAREELGDDSAPAGEQEPLPLFFMKVRYADGVPVGRPVIIDRRTGDEIRRSDIRSVSSRQFERLDGDVLVVADYEGLSRLLLVDGENLEPAATGDDTVYPASALVVRGRNEIYAVVEVDDSWRVGRFDGSLALQAYSAEAVEPASFIEIADDTIYVQNRIGRIIDLPIDELEE